MKTKKLIELLQKEDPSGELECCVGNEDIYVVECLSANYDGCLRVLIKDETSKYYNVKGAKYIRKGYKVQIRPLSVEDAIHEDPDLPIDYTEMGDYWGARQKEKDDKAREEARKIDYEIELELFQEWAKEKCGVDVNEIAEEFFKNSNMKRSDPFPEGLNGIGVGQSYHDSRKLQWGREIEVVNEDGWKFRRKA
jgi:hypothetical protein